MAIFSVYVLNRAGGLIYHYDHHTPKSETEKTFSYPLDITLRGDDKLEVLFGEGGGIKGKKDKDYNPSKSLRRSFKIFLIDLPLYTYSCYFTSQLVIL